MEDPMGVVEFLDLKAETDADLLAMQVGTYEFFADDARRSATPRPEGLRRIRVRLRLPDGGRAVDDLTPYLAALVGGSQVAIADQRDDDADDISRDNAGRHRQHDAPNRRARAATSPPPSCGTTTGAGVRRRSSLGSSRHRTRPAGDAFTELHRFAPVLTGPDLRSDAFLPALRDRNPRR